MTKKVFQTKIFRRTRDELDMPIKDLEERGFELVGIHEIEGVHKSYSHGRPNKIGPKFRFVGASTYSCWMAHMRRKNRDEEKVSADGAVEQTAGHP